MKLILAKISPIKHEEFSDYSQKLSKLINKYINLEIKFFKNEENFISFFEKVKTKELFLFDEQGKSFNSDAFSKEIEKKTLQNSKMSVVFCIGGPYGFSESLRKKGTLMINLSSLTLSGELAYIVALEQIYRAFTIINRHPYHHS